jgi:chemotaxis protein MotB
MRRSRFLILLLMVASLSGCVTSGTYEIKKQEVEALDKALQEERGQSRKLFAEGEQCLGEATRLKKDLGVVTVQRDALVADKKGLEQTLSSTADAKNQKIGELSQKLTDCEGGSRRLKEELTQLQKQKELEVQKTSKTYEELLEQMKSEISKGEVTISELKGKLTVNMVDSVLFDSGKAEVKPAGLAVLEKVISILKPIKDKSIRIEGHTDNVQISGALARRYPTNWELSAARAINVTRYLQQQGVDAALLAAVAYGEFKPVASNDTEEGRAANRRIEIVLVAKE